MLLDRTIQSFSHRTSYTFTPRDEQEKNAHSKEAFQRNFLARSVPRERNHLETDKRTLRMHRRRVGQKEGDENALLHYVPYGKAGAATSVLNEDQKPRAASLRRDREIDAYSSRRAERISIHFGPELLRLFSAGDLFAISSIKPVVLFCAVPMKMSLRI